VLQWYTQEILEPGRQPMFFALLAFLVTFLVTRTITRLIRAGKGPFRNVSAGDTHIHHVIPGLIVLLVGGILALGSGQDGIWRQIAGLMFGIGAALVLDEFAMVLHLDDVYWSNEGRLSADAVTLAAVVLFSAVLVAAPNRPNPDAVQGFWLNFLAAVAFLVFGFLPLLVTILKGKLWMAALSLLVPIVAWVAMFRLAKPGSPWAHFRYAGKAHKLARAQQREERWQRRRQPVLAWIQSHVFGISDRPEAQ
jgi:ABC-type multidrug transport system fused ATPase/permease subunit